MTGWRETVDCDVAVVGAGVVGLAVARACALAGLRVIVVERHGRIGSETSSRNSEVIHAGIYYPTDSLKARFCVAGRRALYDYCAARGIDHRRCGKLILATSDAQIDHLQRLKQQAHRNGVDDLVWLRSDEVRTLEPEVQCTAGLLSPSTGIIDSHGFMQALAADAEAAGAIVALHTTFMAARPRENGIEIDIDDKVTLGTHWLVNCGGLHATAVARCIAGLDGRQIPSSYLAKGHYFSISGRPFSRLIYPLPTGGGLGVHATLDLQGQIRFGPDVEWVDEIDYRLDPLRAAAFYAAIRSFWPTLPDGALKPAYAGIRPKIAGPSELAGDFLISGPATHGLPGLINLHGIESPGLTAALPLGAYVADMITGI